MVLRYSYLVYLMFFLFILLLPLNSLYDTFAYFEGTVGNKTYAKTPIAFKLFKDFFLFVVILLVAERMLTQRINKKLIGVLFFITFVILIGCVSLFWVNGVAIAFAVRSYLVIVFIFLGFYFCDFDLVKLYPVFKFIFFLELTVQILQFFYAPNYYGYVFRSFNLTNPGTFLIPSTMASYSIIVHYYARQISDKKIVALTLLSIFLTQSSTAWMIVIFFYLIIFSKKIRFSKSVVLVILAIASCFIYFNLDAITGRPEILSNLLTRLSIFSNHLHFPFGKGLGLGSGASVLMHLDGATIADSTITSLLINFGWAGIIIFVYFLSISLRYFEYNNLLLIAFFGFSFTMIVVEMTPFIQVYFFELGRQIAQRSAGSDSQLTTT